ncbi:MAG: mechanosensitive ion channel family protein [Candidatus Bathyarchaeia archaeon]
MVFEIADIGITLAILVGSVWIAVGIYQVLKRYIPRVATSPEFQRYLMRIVKGPLSIIIIFNGAAFALQYWNSRYPASLPLGISLNADILSSIAGILVSVIVINLILGDFLSRRIRKLLGKGTTEEQKEKESLFRLVNRVLTYTVYLIGAVMILGILLPGGAESLLGAAVGAGFLGIVIGLGAQRVMGNLLSGVFLNVMRPYRLGDAILFRGDFGFVEKITIRHTIVRTWDNRRLFVPNSVMDDEVIINYSIGEEKMLAPIMVGVSYESDISQARKIMVEVARKHQDCLLTEREVDLEKLHYYFSLFGETYDGRTVELKLVEPDKRRSWVDENGVKVPDAGVRANRKLISPQGYEFTHKSQRISKARELGIELLHKTDEEIRMEISRVMFETAKDGKITIYNEFAASDLPKVQILGFGDNEAKLRVLCIAKDQPTAFGMSCDIREGLLKEFEESTKRGVKVEIPYPRRYLIMGEDKLGMIPRDEITSRRPSRKNL